MNGPYRIPGVHRMPFRFRVELAHRVACLGHRPAGDESAFVTGSERVMDGGVTVRLPRRARGGGRWT